MSLHEFNWRFEGDSSENFVIFLVSSGKCCDAVEKWTGEALFLLLWPNPFPSIPLLPFLTVIVRFVLELQWLGFNDDDSVESLRTTLKFVAIDCCFLILEIRV
jgi:hypothetical protein